MKKTSLILLLILYAIFISSAQNRVVDSLLNVLKTSKADTSKVNTLNNLSSKLAKTDSEQAVKYGDSAVELGKNLKFLKGVAMAYRQLGIIYTMKGDYEKAISNFTNSLDVFKELGDSKGEGRAYVNIGLVYRNQGKIEKALEYCNFSLTIFERISDKVGLATAYSNIGSIYNTQNNYKPALEALYKSLKIYEELKMDQEFAATYAKIALIYRDQKTFDEAKKSFNKCLKIFEKLGNQNAIADVYNNLGILCYDEAKEDTISNLEQRQEFEKQKYLEALDYYSKSLELYKQLESKSRIAMCYYNMGDTYNQLKQYETAFNNFKESLKIREQLKEKSGIANCYNGIGEYYYKKGEYEKSVEVLEKALDIAKATGSVSIQKDALEYLSKSYGKLGMFEKAFNTQVVFKQLNDSLFSANNRRNLTRLNMQYEFDKQQKAQEIKYESEIRQQKLVSAFSFIGLALMVLLAFFIYRNYRIKQKANQKLQILNTEITQQKEEITAQSEEIEKQRDIALHQRDEITFQKKEITDSIHYAKRIQTAVLPIREIFVSIIPDYFILFKPRDIVSGDFYWLNKKDNFIIVAAADCTGHGVPGAFMSMLGVSFLNEIVNKNETPIASEILDSLRNTLIYSLHQTGKFEEAKDGMDIALCVIEIETNILQFSGAYNPLLLVRKDAENLPKLPESPNILVEKYDEFFLYEVKADRMPIGIYVKTKPFTNHIIQLEKSDALYIFSDGYVDQFGGPKGRKVRIQTLKELVIKYQHKAMSEQKLALDQFLTEWKGERDQLDDILVIGMRI